MRLRNLSVLPGLVALVLVSCQTITEEMPTQSTPSQPTSGTGQPVPVVVVQVPIPSPAAPNPVPSQEAPNPNPGSTPAPAPPSSARCSLGPGGGSGNNCPAESPSFLREVESALDQLTAQEPGIFDLRRTRGGCGNCYFVVNPDRYVRRMAELMQDRGFCAVYDGEELAVKNSNRFNDQYDILTSDGFIRRQGGAYRTTCYPAWF
jgi:hypothetical protein